MPRVGPCINHLHSVANRPVARTRPRQCHVSAHISLTTHGMSFPSAKELKSPENNLIIISTVIQTTCPNAILLCMLGHQKTCQQYEINNTDHTSFNAVNPKHFLSVNCHHHQNRSAVYNTTLCRDFQTRFRFRSWYRPLLLTKFPAIAASESVSGSTGS